MTHSRDKQNKNLVQFQYNRLAHLWNATDGQCRGGSRGGGDWGDRPSWNLRK